MLTLLVAITALNSLLIIFGGCYVYKKANRVVHQVSEGLTSVFAPRIEGEPSLFVQIADQITENAASKIGIHTNAAIKGSIGGTMKGLNAALENEAIESDASLALAAALPKSLRKNPVAMMGLQQIMQRVMGQTAHNGSASTGQAKFKL